MNCANSVTIEDQETKKQEKVDRSFLDQRPQLFMVDPAGSFLILSQVNCDGLGSFLFACPCGIQDQCRVCINGYAAEGFSRLRCASLLGMDMAWKRNIIS